MKQLSREQINQLARETYDELCPQSGVEPSTIPEMIVDISLNTIVTFIEKYQEELNK